MEQIQILANRFRLAIEATPSNTLPIGMQNFPIGACGDATPLLGRYLKDQGLGSFEHVLGFRGEDNDRHSHAWLRQGDVIIDITADQFPEVEQAVIVANGSAWHDGFETEVPHEADFIVYDDYTKDTLRAAYRTILQNMEAEA